jgi:two-component system chemotaxis response regulator CheY
MRILSVDDTLTAREFIRVVIDIMGHEFLEAADGREGLNVLERERGNIDLVLLDWNMPVMDGLEMLKKMKVDKRFAAIPVTMVTTEIERPKVIEAIGAGAKNYVMKPFTQEELVEKIMDALGINL